MNIELRFLQKAIEDRNYICFFYDKCNIKNIKPLSLKEKENNYFLQTESETFEFGKIEKLKILKSKF